ncbi:MAG TPA: type IV pilus modification protein PilV [Burkholderiales bacterium]|nr:type IV pilus modification protein PilV [Burkholderiales bacterium]
MAAPERTTRGRSSQAGFSLIEILVALLILTVGLLGLAGMQAVAQRSEVESYQRAQAMVLMNDILDRINANRKAAACYAITTDFTNGVPYVGTSGSGQYSTGGYSCPSLASNPNAASRAGIDLQLIEQAMLGASETLGSASVGALLGARACIGFDSAAQAYTVAIAWQGQSQTFSPASWAAGNNPAVARNCALNLYGTDTQRRVIWTTLMVASLSS